MRSDPSYLYPEELADEGMGGKIRLIYPLAFRLYPLALADEGMGDKIKPIYPLAFVQRGLARGFAKISPVAIGPAGLSKRFCQNKPR